MSYAQLLGVLLLYYSVQYSNGQCTIGNLIGEVFEFADSGFEVMNFDYNGETNEIVITLEGNLVDYFEVVGETMVVSGNRNITRDVSFAGAQVACVPASGATNPTRNEVFVTVKEINSVNDVEFDESSYSFSVDETLDIGSTFTVRATDQDESTITYSILQQNPTGFFRLLSTTSGIIELIKPLDHDQNSEHTLRISATSSGFDSAGETLDQTAEVDVVFTVIDINTLPPVFQPCEATAGDDCVPPLYTAEVNTNVIDNVVIEPPISAVDGDTGINSPITYSFVSGSPTDFGDYFSIDPGSGVVSMLKPVIDPTFNRFGIAVQARETNGGKTAINYLVIDVVVADDNKPIINDSPSTGFISQSSFDNNILSVITEDEEGNTPLKLVVTDADDAEATFTFEISSPYLVSNDGILYFAPTSTQAYASEEIQVRAINLNAELNSPNRKSDPVTLTIEAAANPTTSAPITSTTHPQIIVTTSTTTKPETEMSTSEANDVDDHVESLPNSCKQIRSSKAGDNFFESGIYYLRDNNNFTFAAYCDMNIDGGGWTLVATIHENNIRTSTGRCTTGDKWSSESGNDVGSQAGAEAWFNYATFGNVISATSEDYKNPAYFGIQARDIMIWQIPNDTPLQQFDSGAYLKFRTTNGFLRFYGGNMFNLYNDFFPIISGVFTAVADNGPAIPVIFDEGSKTDIRNQYGPNLLATTDAGYIEFRAINNEQNAYALCPGLRAQQNAGHVEHHCIGSTADNADSNYCGDFSAFVVDDYGSGQGWNAHLSLLQTTFMIFYR